MRIYSIVCVLFSWLFLQVPVAILAQNEVCCDTATVMTICYLSGAKYCASELGNCPGYSLDGNNMIYALTSKLLSPDNFGPTGIVNCPIEILELMDISSTQAITDEGCDIIFLPTVFINPISFTQNIESTFIPVSILSTIYEWSKECEQNLVIATQGEATFWGYVVQDENVNPNTAAPGPKPLDIFNGPFGSLNQFMQGGSFQGVFTGTPSSGMVVLANDKNGRPTVCLDKATNDILLGDIGIFCTNAGPISNGPGINNNNDILACNIFALACEIALVVPPTQQYFEICPLDTVVLPDGIVVNIPGVYIDTLLSIHGCDSIIITEIVPRIIPPTTISHDGCQGDQFSISLNGMVFDESNPTDTVLIENEAGCDSMIIIDLRFKPNSSASAVINLCPGESYQLSNGQAIFAAGVYPDTISAFNGCDSTLTLTVNNLMGTQGAASYALCRGDVFLLSNGVPITKSGAYTDTLTGVNGCDSLVLIDLLFDADTTYLERLICAEDVLQINGQTYVVGQTYLTAMTNSNGCDSLLFTELIPMPEPDVNIPLFITVKTGDVSPFKQSVSTFYALQWTPDTGLSCADCPNPTLDRDVSLANYVVTLTDTLGCIWPYPIALDYVCNYYVPNGFSPNGDGINDVFKLLGSACRIDQFRMNIYDRWGGLIFQSNDKELGWDGRSDKQDLDPGVYTYTITFTSYGRERLISGEVLLLK